MKPSNETWKEIVINALDSLGGEAHLEDINHIIQKHPRTRENKHWREKIRQVVRRYNNFEPVPPKRSGVYRLLSKPKLALQEEKLTNDSVLDHGTTQGMLLTLGTLFGYETYAPKNDQTMRLFQNEKLSHFVSIKDLSIGLSPTTHKRLQQIDVLWCDEDEEGFYPRYAFEVEHTTKVKKGILRLIEIPERYAVQRYIIAPGVKEKKLFENYIIRSPYNLPSKILHFHLYSEIEQLYNNSILFSQTFSLFEFSIKSFNKNSAK